MASCIPVMLALAATIFAKSQLPDQHPHHPDISAARQNAFAIFNAVHSAMRQWGSSLHHNGMSFYLAQAPEGSVFYHGGFTATRPTTFEWLAFEFEHAANFAQSWEGRPASHLYDVLLWRQFARFRVLEETGSPSIASQFDSSQQPLSILTPEAGDDDDNRAPPGGPPNPDYVFRGYFQTYRANRNLNLVYIDGEGAAKCPLGTMDSQDLILLGWNHTADNPREHMLVEFHRANELCALANEWAFSKEDRIDGFIRMEAGFEIIYCDFSPSGGLDLTTVQASPFSNESNLGQGQDARHLQFVRVFEWLRASAARFQGHPTGRLDVDWSSMVSAFFYPLRLSNPDVTRPDLPRLLNTSKEERSGIRSRLRDVVIERGGSRARVNQSINWQGVVDRIVTRYSQRLDLITNQDLEVKELLVIISTLVDPFIDYLDRRSNAEHSAADRCAQHFMQPSVVQSDKWTLEDHAIFAAIETVSQNICTALLEARRILKDDLTITDGELSGKQQVRNIVRALVQKLRWSTWKECGSCAVNEICSIPMFPIGTLDDYFNPACKNLSRLNMGYFGNFT